MNEFDAKAWLPVDGIARLADVAVIFEADGYKPLGLWIEDEHGNDVTTEVSQDEYDRLYEEASRFLIEYMTDAAEYLEER